MVRLIFLQGARIGIRTDSLMRSWRGSARDAVKSFDGDVIKKRVLKSLVRASGAQISSNPGTRPWVAVDRHRRRNS
jgi:hypothetical protein